MISFAEAAIPYAERGLAVVPVDMRPGERNKRPLIAYGGERRPLSPSALRRFGERRPDAGIALNVGHSNLVLVDIDSPDLGFAADIFDRFGGTHVKARTPGGGSHGWFRDPEGEARSANLRTSEGLPVDIKARAALGIVPPTLNPAKRGAYRPIAMSSAEFVEALLKAPPIDHSGLPQGVTSQVVPQGRRNDEAFNQVRLLAFEAPSLDALMDRMRAWNEANCVPPLSESEIVGKCRRAWQYREQGTLYLPGARYTPIVSLAETDALMGDPYAGMLLYWLRAHHPPHHVFKISPKGIGPRIGWNAKTVRKVRDSLIRLGHVEPIGCDPVTRAAIYRLMPPRGVHQTDPIELKHPPPSVGPPSATRPSGDFSKPGSEAHQ